MQYRGKIPKGGQLADKKAQWTCDDLRNHIDYLIQNIELFAVTIEKGLIR